MQKIDIINALRSAVIFSPENELTCKQLQTFRVIEKGSGGIISAENFGATMCDKENPWFWSRLWAGNGYNPNAVTWEFPVLALIETSYTAKRPLAQNSERCYEFNLSVLDIPSVDCGKWKCKGCKGRTINQVYEDTETLLFSALRYLAGLVEATLPDGTTGVYHVNHLDAMVAARTISGYTRGVNIGSVLESNIQNASAYKTSLGAGGIVGNAINIQVCVKNCVVPEYNFNTPSFAALAHEAGCKSCG
jgi:hypothetical protein